MSEQTILITGGAGYIGSHTIIALSEMTNSRIVSVDNYSNSSAETYNRIKSILGKDIEHVEADLSDKNQVEKVFGKFKGITGIIHFAAHKSVPESVENPLEYYRNNLFSLINILSCAKEFSVPHFIFSSSCSIYGNISQLPVNENTPPSKPESPYASTKIIGEEIVRESALASDSLKTISLRYFNPVGAHPSAQLGELPLNKPNNLVPVITQTAIGIKKEFTVFGNDYGTRDGTCIRDYVHVCDIARAHVLALRALEEKKITQKNETLNLGTGKGVTVLEAIHSFEKVSGVKPSYKIGPRRAGDVEAIYSDCSKVKKILGWQPEFSLDDMMDSAWKWELHLAGK